MPSESVDHIDRLLAFHLMRNVADHLLDLKNNLEDLNVCAPTRSAILMLKFAGTPTESKKSCQVAPSPA